MFVKLHWKNDVYGMSFTLNINEVYMIQENEDGTASILLSQKEDDVLLVKESYEEICDLLSEVE